MGVGMGVVGMGMVEWKVGIGMEMVGMVGMRMVGMGDVSRMVEWEWE